MVVHYFELHAISTNGSQEHLTPILDDGAVRSMATFLFVMLTLDPTLLQPTRSLGPYSRSDPCAIQPITCRWWLRITPNKVCLYGYHSKRLYVRSWSTHYFLPWSLKIRILLMRILLHDTRLKKWNKYNYLLLQLVMHCLLPYMIEAMIDIEIL